MDHGDGTDHFHHPCSRYIYRLSKVSKVGICCGYHLYHDFVTIQEEVRITSFGLFTLDGLPKRLIILSIHKIMD